MMTDHTMTVKRALEALGDAVAYARIMSPDGKFRDSEMEEALSILRTAFAEPPKKEFTFALLLTPEKKKDLAHFLNIPETSEGISLNLDKDYYITDAAVYERHGSEIGAKIGEFIPKPVPPSKEKP